MGCVEQRGGNEGTEPQEMFDQCLSTGPRLFTYEANTRLRIVGCSSSLCQVNLGSKKTPDANFSDSVFPCSWSEFAM